MNNTEVEVLNAAATIEKLKKVSAGRALNRRHFMAALGMTSAVAGAGLLTGCTSVSSPVVSAGIGQTDVLNFALNLEYLEATFYSYIVNGTDLPAAQTVGSGAVTGAPAKLVFTGTTAGQISDLLGEIYYDEMSHVSDLRSVLGSLAIARPAINLAAAGAISISNAITLAREFEDVGATAYAGAAALLSGTNLTYAAQILAVEGFHAGALRLIGIQNPTFFQGYTAADALDVKPADPGTAALAAAGPVGGAGFFATSGAANATKATPAGFAYTRTTSQVLSIVYANATAGTSAGGFFPGGMNGLIKTI